MVDKDDDDMTPRRAPRRSALIAGLILAVALTDAAAYHFGKQCGAWEAKRRVHGAEAPLLCFR